MILSGFLGGLLLVVEGLVQVVVTSLVVRICLAIRVHLSAVDLCRFRCLCLLAKLS